MERIDNIEAEKEALGKFKTNYAFRNHDGHSIRRGGFSKYCH